MRTAAWPGLVAALRNRSRGWNRIVGTILWAGVAATLPSNGAAAEAAESFLDYFEIEGSLEVKYERKQNFDLDSSRADDLDELQIELALELDFEPNEYFGAKFQPTLKRDFELHEEGRGEDRETELLIEEAYVTLTDPNYGLSLRVGRQSFEDDRQWLFDADLDAFRAFLRQSALFLEFSISRKALLDQDLLNAIKEDSITNYILYGGYDLTEDVTVGAYEILRDSNEIDRDNLVFFGLYSTGIIDDRLTYWFDAAHVRGHEDDSEVRGYGIDVLGTYRFDLPLSPHIILGYAFGSGDADPEDGRDGSFRQTGLQGNEAEVGGLTPFLYYGEAFDPELSNMSIFTAGLGIRPSEGTSLNLIYHHYRQDKAIDELRDSAFDAEPNGRSRRLGNEIDLVLGFGETEDIAVRGLLGFFMPGKAFGDGADNALFAKVEVRYEF